MSVVQIGLLLLASFFLMLALSVPVSISLIVSSLGDGFGRAAA